MGRRRLGRGEPLDTRDQACPESIAKLGELFDRSWAEAEWDAALAAPIWTEARYGSTTTWTFGTCSRRTAD